MQKDALSAFYPPQHFFVLVRGVVVENDVEFLLLRHGLLDLLQKAQHFLMGCGSSSSVAQGLLRAARQELLDPSKAWWGGRRGRLADRRCCPLSVSLGVVPLVLACFVEVPVRIEVAAGS